MTLPLYGPHGRLLDREEKLETAADTFFGAGAIDPGIKGGWIEAGGMDKPRSSVSQILGLDLNRDVERKSARTAYMVNPILAGAVELIHSFVMGEEIAYGETADKKVNTAVEDFWFANDIDYMADRYFKEFLLDGENLTLFPKGLEGREEAARIGFYDVDEHLVIETEPGLPHIPSKVKVKGGLNNGEEVTYDNTEFTWTAHDALWNDPRGWPVIMRAVGPALAYVGFANTRLRIHDLQARINAVYYAYASDEVDLAKKAATYTNLPSTGKVLTLHKLPTGEKEEFEFLETRTNATDSAADGRLIRLILAVALNLPEHYLGEGGEVNRSTADAMGAPAKKAFQRKQKWVKRWLNTIFRREMVRRYGPNARYTVKKYKVSEKGGGVDVSTSRVPIERFEFAWLFPEINDEDAMGLVRKVQLAAEFKLASRQTLSGELGYDYAAELERIPRDLEQESEEQGNATAGANGGSKLNQGVNKQAGRNKPVRSKDG